MHDVVLVGIVQCFGDFGDNVQGAHWCHCACAQRLIRVGAVDELHRDPQPPREFPASANRHDVGMIQCRGHLGFSREAAAEIRVMAQLRGEHFQRVAAREIWITSQINGTHSPDAEHPLDSVPGEYEADA